MKTRVIIYGALLVVFGIAGLVGWSWIQRDPYKSARHLAPDRTDPAHATQAEFERVQRPGAVDLEAAFAMHELQIPIEQVHTILPKDGILALTDPSFETPTATSEWLTDDARVVLVEVDGEAVAAPLAILSAHEVINTTVGGVPIAIVYCPLCDAATVVDRRLPRMDPKTGRLAFDDECEVLEFGVSGALYNSNVLLYEKTSRGLWSQLGMQAVSGPDVGVSLQHLPVRVVAFGAAREGREDSLRVVARDTSSDDDYTTTPNDDYLTSAELQYPVADTGTEMDPKALGLGILAGGKAYFASTLLLGEGTDIETPLGTVRARATDSGVEVLEAPEDVRTAQAFYFAWSAFHPQTEVLGLMDTGGP